MIPRSSLKDTYDQILSDLDDGIADLMAEIFTSLYDSILLYSLHFSKCNLVKYFR